MKRLTPLLLIGILLLAGCNGTASEPESVSDTEEDLTGSVEITEADTAEPASTLDPEVLGPSPGADGIGDPYFPQMGNGGYDTQHYTIRLAVNLDQQTIAGSTTIEIVALQDLSAFNLDFSGLEISEVRVDDQPVEFARSDGELTVIPSEIIDEGQSFTVDVDYSGTPGEGVPNLTSLTLGWYFYEEGVFVAGEPSGSSNWYPVNEHPLDKASYTFEITVPKPYGVAANGLLQDTIEHDLTVTYIWESQYPMASYLVTVNIAEFDVEEETGPDGLPIRNYFEVDVSEGVRSNFDRTGEMIEFYSEIFGPYPFEAYGGVVHDIDLGFALETQTISLFGSTFATEEVIAHELAHQWFGDSVSLETWEDIWLNEGFATYAGSVLWEEHKGGQAALEGAIFDQYNLMAQAEAAGMFTVGKEELVSMIGRFLEGEDISSLQQPEGRILTPEQAEAGLIELVGDVATEGSIEAAMAEFPADGLPAGDFPALLDTVDFVEVEMTFGRMSAFFRAVGMDEEAEKIAPLIIGSPPPDDLFNSSVYQRGSLTLHALRLEVGDDAFFEILRTYYDQYQGGNASIEDFIALAEEISGQELDDLFDAWLYQEKLPDLPEMGLYREDFVE